MIDFKKTIDNLQGTGFLPVPDLVNISVTDAKKILWCGLKYFIGDKVQWLPEYDQVVTWLSDNKGKGLLCQGDYGRGKTLICGRVMPVLLNYYCQRLVFCYDAQQMNTNPEVIKQKHIIYLDDIGTESIRVNYGEKRMAFPELVDEAEKRGKLLIITTNLSKDEIKEKYGERTLDRLRAITTPVRFVGKSLR